ncbi:hypothetical protein MC145_000748 [Salmonella enterica]|nr:hypothetical protein [Salmonella enterica subsp. enterica serovar Sandiego]EIW3687263.1 hypothetical protein [Salmonella enterica]EJN4045240.1 hypothetical protein [Salmonella enterica]QVA90909.1 hypothetical protein JYM69_23205 [Salmonella enterica subsp. enterica serovar Sandiego]
MKNQFFIKCLKDSEGWWTESEIFWPGDAAEFDILGYVIAVKSAIRAAGIKVKES